MQSANISNSIAEINKISQSNYLQKESTPQGLMQSPLLGSNKKRYYEYQNEYKSDFKPSQVQHIVLIAKKIEKQSRESKGSPVRLLGDNNYRIQTAQYGNKYTRNYNQQFTSNLIKGQTFYDTGYYSNQTKQDLGANNNTPSSIFSYSGFQQQQFESQYQSANNMGRTLSSVKNYPLTGFQTNKPDIFSQIQNFQQNQPSKNATQNQNTSPKQKSIQNEKSQENNQLLKIHYSSTNQTHKSPLQGRQFFVSELNRQVSDQNNNFTSAYSQQAFTYQQGGGRSSSSQVQQSSNYMQNIQFSPNQQNFQQIAQNKEESYYKYIVNYGNNCLIVKRVMETRENWRAIETHNTAYNFRWCPISQAVKFDRIGIGMKQLVNHLEFHKELTCKYTLIKNLKPYCEQNKINMFTLTPLTFLIDLDDENCDSSLKRFAKFFYKHMPKNSSVLKKPENPKKAVNEFVKRLKPLMQYPMQDKKEKPNPFSKPKMHESFANGENYFWFLKPTGTNRGRGIYIFNQIEQLEKYIQEYYVGMEEKPLTKKKEIVPNKQEQEQLQQQQQQQQLQQQIIEAQNCQQKKENSQEKESNQIQDQDQLDFKSKFQFQQKVIQQLQNHQQQLQITSVSPNLRSNENYSPEKNQQDQNADQSKKRKNTQSSANKDPVSIIKCHQFVVQKYVERPMLINNRKFDIRAWVLVTHTMDVYFFKESVIRTSGQKFNLDNNQINNHFIHLTNNAVQRYADNYGEFENGNQMSLANFFKYCQAHHPNECDTSKMHQDMKNIVYHTMNCVKRKINPEDRKYTFEIYGYDFLVDDKFNIWLLEINTNPCLDESSPHLQQALPRMLDDAFKLTLDIIFPKTKILQKQQPQINKSPSQIVSPAKAMMKAKSPKTLQNITNSIRTEQNETKLVLQEEQVIVENEQLPQSLNMIDGKSIVFENKNENSDSASPKCSSTTQQDSQISNSQPGHPNNSNYIYVSSTVKQSLPQRLTKKETNWPVDGFPDEENMWEFLLNIYCPKPKSNHSQKKSTF
ncbi:tubulin-tyrosine ligase family protein (macronuclear) [Tetrahymena thermophila SB210]|uniref:Tubulin-tyrosine ligase family protein n=1 Tax=Tetrahymena thermophila (strain SB210) TaxID=312017 RepID=Q22MF2_TETTS|nr:tubulin-tyrosine ligase family protein [Tetrahymena thermophila SB210]EAR86536.2 tubulin-tyrosine ligase family protein [Tetrahymena thermophila SB210]|eukprot:XP_977068.2 tubulin-tyrosine ligase family protein [Tetrahymena thermophila SB210]